MCTLRPEVSEEPPSSPGAGDFRQVHPGQVFCIGCRQPESLCGAAVLEKHSCGSRDGRGLWLPGWRVSLKMGKDGQWWATRAQSVKAGGACRSVSRTSPFIGEKTSPQVFPETTQERKWDWILSLLSTLVSFLHPPSWGAVSCQWGLALWRKSLYALSQNVPGNYEGSWNCLPSFPGTQLLSFFHIH